MFTLAHLSDIHLPPLPAVKMTELMNKRILGYINWQAKRKNIHRRDILDAIVADLKSQSPNHIAISGDLTNLGLPTEYKNSLSWLNSLGGPEHISVVPGNHDAYTAMNPAKGWHLWRDYMSTDEIGDARSGTPKSDFPYVKILGDVALIGASSAVPTRPFMATGAIDEEQLQSLSSLLQSLRKENKFRICMIHHPPLSQMTSPRRALRRVEQFEELLLRDGAELVLYGHNHMWARDEIRGKNGKLFAIQAPSASQAKLEGYPPAGYNLLVIEQQGESWVIEHKRRGFDKEDGAIIELSSDRIEFS